MIVDIYTSTVTEADGIPAESWTFKETRLINWSPIGWEAKVQMGVGAGGMTYPADSRAWLENSASVVVGNRLYQDSGTTKYVVLSTFEYEDHTEIELKKVIK